DSYKRLRSLENNLMLNKVRKVYENLNRQWTERDVTRYESMLNKINAILKEQRWIQRLEVYVGGRPSSHPKTTKIRNIDRFRTQVAVTLSKYLCCLISDDTPLYDSNGRTEFDWQDRGFQDGRGDRLRVAVTLSKYLCCLISDDTPLYDSAMTFCLCIRSALNPLREASQTSRSLALSMVDNAEEMTTGSWLFSWRKAYSRCSGISFNSSLACAVAKKGRLKMIETNSSLFISKITKSTGTSRSLALSMVDNAEEMTTGSWLFSWRKAYSSCVTCVLDGSHDNTDDDTPPAKDGEVATVDATSNPSRVWKKKTERAVKRRKKISECFVEAGNENDE
nr:hypothetical protein [Tanacetum cinerariifolium]